jgi:hypothetical protein
MINKDKTIFITIPAYEDPLLIQTIRGALDNALNPDRLFFCIGMQYSDSSESPDVSRYVDNPNFIFLFYDVSKRPGVYWIRREMAEQHSGQDYFLMLDSHMTFSQNWDAKIINDYEDLIRMHGERVVMSTALSPQPGDTCNDGTIDLKSCWSIDWNNDIKSIERTILPGNENVSWDGERYQRTLYSCSHFFFTNKNYLSDVGFHQTIRSYSEEYTIAVTTFLSGWDYYRLPEFAHLGHNDVPTAKAIYKKDKYSLADGKRYQAIFETPEEKLEIERFVLLDSSSIFKVKNQRRSIEEFYELGGKDLKDAREKFLEIFGLK